MNMIDKRYWRDRSLDSEKKREIEKRAKNKICITIANNIRDYIVETGISQKEFAKKVGCKPASLTEYINAETEPKATLLLNMAKEMNISVDYLLGKKKFKNPDDSIGFIHEKTGLSNEAIENLERLNGTYKEDIIGIINFLIENDLYFPEEENMLSKLVEIDNYDTSEDIKQELRNEIEQKLNEYGKVYNSKNPLYILSKLNEFFTVKFNIGEKIYATKNGAILENNIKEELQKALIKYTNKEIVLGDKLIDGVLLDDIRDTLKSSKEKYWSIKGSSDK